MQSLALSFLPAASAVAAAADGDHVLVMPSASGVAIPVRKLRRAEDLRDIVSVETVKNLSEALDEPVPPAGPASH